MTQATRTAISSPSQTRSAPVLQTPISGLTPIQNRQAKLLIAGPIGTGKSTLLMTLPGRKLIYAFDPNAVDSYPPADDWDHLPFFPPAEELEISVKPLSTKVKADTSKRHSRKTPEPLTYVRFEEDFQTRCESGWFAANSYNWICFDSNTTFADICMDRIQWLNGRYGKHPEQADYTALMNLQRNCYRAAIGTGLNVAVTMHTEYEKDSVTNRISQALMTTGKNKIRIPLLFSQIYGTEKTVRDGNIRYTLHTAGGTQRDYCRTNIKNLAPEEDVTLNFNQPLSGQGAGAFVLPPTETANAE